MFLSLLIVKGMVTKPAFTTSNIYNDSFAFSRTTLARWRANQLGTLGGKERRPYLASECKDLKECERWRREILREISKKVTQIQNGNRFNT